MKKSRILVLDEDPGPGREVGLSVPDHAVEFDYRAPSQLSDADCDLSSYAAVAVPIRNARPDLIDLLSGPRADGGPVFLYRGAPPLEEAAHWVIHGTPAGRAPEGKGDGQLLPESLEYYAMTSLYRQCLRMMVCHDAGGLIARITDAFTGEMGTQGCVMWLPSPDEPDEFIVASVHGAIAIDGEGSRFRLSQSDLAEAVWAGLPFPAPSGGLYVPLRHQAKTVGLVKLGDRDTHGGYAEPELHTAQVLADYAAAALNTVNRLGRIDKISLRDPETGAHSAAFLEDYFEKEKNKAGRFRRPLSVVFLVFENIAFLSEQTRENVVTGAVVATVDAIRRALRESDLLARQDANRFCIVLPETDSFGAALAVRRLRKAIRDTSRIRFLGIDFSLQAFFMSATSPRDGRDLKDLMRLAEEKHLRQQKSALHRMRLRERPFWEAFDLLVGKPDAYDLLRRGEEVPFFQRIRRDLGRNGHFSMPRENFLRVLEAIAQDIAGTREERGIVIVAGPTPEIYKQIFLSYQPEPPSKKNIYIVGQAGSTRFDARNLLYISAEDEMLKDREVILCLKENGAYGLFGADRGEEVEGFNTADEWLVDAMIEKFQEMYLLQGNF
ncbi:MAG: diguanylate cyclase [Verrucomicrobiota bacterium]